MTVYVENMKEESFGVLMETFYTCISKFENEFFMCIGYPQNKKPHPQTQIVGVMSMHGLSVLTVML
jgi:hypothetical protein